VAQKETEIMNYEAVIGLEVHAHLKTKTKAFCGCPTQFGQEPNSQVCPVCMGFPGALPVFNQEALDFAIKTALALGCQVQEYTKFDRKNYFYPDLPKNYQISQYDLPLSLSGFLDIIVEEKPKRIGIRRVHMEEDAGKLIHKDEISLVDFNRSGMPLLEIVSEPEINSPQEAYEYLSGLKSILEYLEVSDCDMEKGSLRCDANISLRKPGVRELGVKTELKNMNSFKAVKEALEFEINRQSKLLDEGQAITQETRLWDAKEAVTVPMRSKEEAQDYRYFPEPDLPPFTISKEKIAEMRKAIPELARQKQLRFISEFALSEYDARILTASKKDAEFAEKLLREFPDKNKKPIANWLIGPLLSEANARGRALFELGLESREVIELVGFVARQEISNLSAKAVLTEMIDTKKTAQDIIKERNLLQVSDSASLEAVLDEVVKENPNSVNDYKAGKVNALMFLVGQAMKKSKGKANPKVLQDLLKRRLTDA
jgi:aspartyl-tRNA(Asn)/glutamyl-tRNA(Gln) amidotransferase subunit B